MKNLKWILLSLILTSMTFVGNCTLKSFSSAVCGNGIVDTGETCDDGNTVSGDGCSSTCQIETTTSGATTGPTLVENATFTSITVSSDAGVNVLVPVTAGVTYTLFWDDSWQGSGTYTLDGQVSATNPDGTTVIDNSVSLPSPITTIDSGYYGHSFVATQTGNVTMNVSPLYSGNTGTVGVMFTGTHVLSYTNGDGVSELTDVPTITSGSPVTTATPGAVTISISVDTDTLWAMICLVDRANNATNSCLTSTTVTSGLMSVSITPGANQFTAGSSVYVRVFVAASAAGYIGGTSTNYDILNGSTGTTYREAINGATAAETLVPATFLTIQ